MNELLHKFDHLYRLAKTLAAKNCRANGVSKQTQQASWETLKTIKQLAKEIHHG